MLTNKNEIRERVADTDWLLLRPATLIIVSAIFIGSIVLMGMFSIERTQKTLFAFLEARCITSANILERIAQESLNIMAQESAPTGKDKFIPFGEEVFSPEKILVATIGDKAKKIDTLFANKNSKERINQFAHENNIRVVVIFDEDNKAIFQNVPMPEEFFSGKAKDILYKSEPSMEMLEQLARLKKLSFIALQRKNKSGTIVMVIDDTGLRYWGIRVSVEKAMRELRHGQEFEYMRVFDNSYRLLGYTGNMANNTIDNERENISEIINNESSRISHHTVVAGKRIVGMFMPLNLNGKRVGVIHIGMGWGGTDQILEENRRNIFVFVFFVALLTMIALWILYRSHKLHISNILEMERQIEKAERLSSLGKLAAGVAHEIRNPLNAISMAAQRMKRDFTPADPTKVEEFSSLATVIRDEIRRLDGIIEEFLSLSKTRRLDIQPYPLTEMIQKIVSLMDAQAQEKGISFQTDFDENLLVPIDADKFQQALLNIIKNAIESITETGIISISANKINDETAKVVITDNGCGMSQNEIEHIFNPEYTTKEKGLGLGLTLSYEIIRGHGGKINVSSKENRGTAFEIVLPLEKIG